jgi:hypothetical protein
MDSARPGIKRNSNPRFRSQMASYDLASAIQQSLVFGGHVVLKRNALPLRFARRGGAGGQVTRDRIGYVTF